MNKSTREQVQELRRLHPDWAKTEIAKACVPPVSFQRVGQIANGRNYYRTENYKQRMRHKYHKIVGKKFKNCRYCEAK